MNDLHRIKPDKSSLNDFYSFVLFFGFDATLVLDTTNGKAIALAAPLNVFFSIDAGG